MHVRSTNDCASYIFQELFLIEQKKKTLVKQLKKMSNAFKEPLQMFY